MDQRGPEEVERSLKGSKRVNRDQKEPKEANLPLGQTPIGPISSGTISHGAILPTGQSLMLPKYNGAKVPWGQGTLGPKSNGAKVP